MSPVASIWLAFFFPFWQLLLFIRFFFLINPWMCESRSIVSDYLWPHGLYSPWNSPGQNTGVGNHSLHQGIFPTQDWTQVSHIAGGFFTIWVTREAQEYWNGCLSLLQGLFLTQELNQGLLHCRWILYQLSYQGSPIHIHIYYMFT